MSNLYQTPQSRLQNEAYASMRIFALSGRIGRLRYLVYSFLFGLGGLLLEKIIDAVLPFELLFSSGFLVDWSVGGLLVVALLILSFRRLQDLNHEPWLAVLMLVPVLNFFFWLYLLCAAGSAGKNSHGLPPPPNPPGMALLALVLIVIMLGILFLFFGSIFALLMFLTAGSW